MDTDFDCKKFRILIVDDTLANVEVLGKTLRLVGYNIAIAESGEKALAIIGKVKPDLILLDVMMPGMDGFETCKKLKSNPTTMHIPIIFITAKTEISDLGHGFQVGAVDYITKPFHDEEVRARVKTHLMLKNAQDELKQLNIQKNKFLAMAAHDLRSPLTAIIGFTELLQMDLDIEQDDEKKEMLSMILNASKQMKFLVTDLLDVAVINNGELPLNIQQDDLSDLIKKRGNMAKLSADRKNIEIKVECDGVVLCNYDSFRIGQVLENLISNAIKFSPPDSKIKLSLSNAQNGARICVTDEGPGLTDDDLSKIFQDFQKLSARPTAGESSTGLGLAICKRVVDAHGGNIFVANNSTRGATFTLILPLAA